MLYLLADIKAQMYSSSQKDPWVGRKPKSKFILAANGDEDSY